MTFLPVIVRGDEAEVLPTIEHVLLVDGSTTEGALSSHRVQLSRGAPGARPHRHDRSSELFYVVDGALDVLIDHKISTASAGDLVVVPPSSPHAFAASADHPADVLIVITPGIDRFDYLRQVEKIRAGHAAPDSLDSEQQRYDTYFLNSAAWARHLTSRE